MTKITTDKKSNTQVKLQPIRLKGKIKVWPKLPASDREGKDKLTSRVSKFSADCGFLIRDSSLFSRLSSLLSAPSMIAARGLQVE
ncbi:hypothetical protein EYF80_040515 [Liparis tanakae]|uniref:Uncharacterized protein n=1 Tax=Liparis tanakae TaxID=230148 RepID=A0A4Z2G6U0_9TELE|nr:hypothetical protein EYF80_040515 [Liparis tanakae]